MSQGGKDNEKVGVVSNSPKIQLYLDDVFANCFSFSFPDVYLKRRQSNWLTVEILSNRI
jgi:hypothetical protein